LTATDKPEEKAGCLPNTGMLFGATARVAAVSAARRLVSARQRGEWRGRRTGAGRLGTLGQEVLDLSEKRIVLATKNPGKVREFRALLEGHGIEVVGLDPHAPEVAETGTTFEENALIKARAAVAATGLPALAEDAGICVDALGGEPGVRSARWVPGSDEDRLRDLLARMEGVPADRRGARYVSVIAVVLPSGRWELFRGEWEGRLAEAPRGTGGFGYDPIFELPDGRTVAELSLEEKNAMSHRSQSLAKCLKRLPALLEEE